MEYVDIDKNAYRTSVYIFGFEIPTHWRELPPVDYISVFKAHIKSGRLSRGGGDSSMHTTEIQINFIYNKQVLVTAYSTDDKEKAIAKAKEYAKKLGNLRLLDATQKPFVWLDEEE